MTTGRRVSVHRRRARCGGVAYADHKPRSVLESMPEIREPSAVRAFLISLALLVLLKALWLLFT